MNTPTPTRTIDPDVAPTADLKRWERGTDPWHRDKFPTELADQAPHQDDTPRPGWFELDSWGNQIGFVPDGTPV